MIGNARAICSSIAIHHYESVTTKSYIFSKFHPQRSSQLSQHRTIFNMAPAGKQKKKWAKSKGEIYSLSHPAILAKMIVAGGL